jgi:hypothetical protein
MAYLYRVDISRTNTTADHRRIRSNVWPGRSPTRRATSTCSAQGWFAIRRVPSTPGHSPEILHLSRVAAVQRGGSETDVAVNHAIREHYRVVDEWGRM